MKKIVFWILFVLLWTQFSFAMVWTDNERVDEILTLITSEVAINVCGEFTEKELTTLKALSFILWTKWEMLDQKASEYTNSDEYEIAVEKRKEFIAELKKTTKCDWWFKNYDDFKKWILSYVVKLNNLKKTQEKGFLSKYPEADKIIIDSQKKLLFAGKDWFDIINWVFNEKTEHNIKLEVGDKESEQMFFPNFKLNAWILSDWFFDLYNKKIDLNLWLKWDSTIWMNKYNYETDERIMQEYKLWGDIQWSLKLSKDAIYMMLKKFDITASPLDDSQVQDLVEFREKVQKITNKWIKVVLDVTKRRDIAEITKSLNKIWTIQTLYSQSLLQFLHKEGNVYYAVPSMNICKLVDWYQKQSCYNGIKDTIEKTSKKGFITLTVNWGNYELWFSWKFVSEDKEWFDDTMWFLTKKPILTWNASEIQTITIPFDEEGQNWFFVENKKVTVVYKDDSKYSPIDLKFDWTYDQNWIDLNWKVLSDWFDVDLDLSFIKEGDKYSSVINVNVKDDEDKKMWSLEYNVSKVVKSVSNYNFTYPSDSEVLTVEEVEELME